jgi:hypothetical protein
MGIRSSNELFCCRLRICDSLRESHNQLELCLIGLIKSDANIYIGTGNTISMNRIKRLGFSFVVGFLLGGVITLLYPAGNILIGWLGTTLLISPSVYILLTGWQWAGKSTALGWMILLAFLLRLGFSISLNLILPDWGYDNPHQSSGYLFRDSYHRDQAAWALSQDETPLWAAFGEEFTSDQYGGLLSLSAAIYRYISPDAHRPHLIYILISFIGALSVPFFWKGINGRWGERIANLATGILVLYPEGIFYSVSQMREPFMIAGGAIAFWAVLNWKLSRRSSTIALICSIGLMGLISWRLTIGLIGILAIWLWLENRRDRVSKRNTPQWIIPVVIIVVIAAGLTSLSWLRTSMWWDFRMTEQNSERLVIEIERIGEQWRAPVIVAFGTAQVVLPAAIAQPSIPLWRVLTILRSAGWYALAPFLLYALYAAWKVPDKNERLQLFWLILATYSWIIIASARAGGDLWDNPRYRTIFLPWMAFLAAWCWHHRDAWLGRLILMEAIFLAFFTEWYLARYYYGEWIRMPFWSIIIWVVGLSALVIIGGVGGDYYRSRKTRQLQVEMDDLRNG